MRPSDLKKEILKRNPGVALEVKKDLAFQVALHLEESRLVKGYTQKELADKVGTHQSNIARAERGSSLPSLTFLKKIAEAFDTYLIPPRFAFMVQLPSAPNTAGEKARNDYAEWGASSARILTATPMKGVFTEIGR